MPAWGGPLGDQGVTDVGVQVFNPEEVYKK